MNQQEVLIICERVSALIRMCLTRGSMAHSAWREQLELRHRIESDLGKARGWKYSRSSYAHGRPFRVSKIAAPGVTDDQIWGWRESIWPDLLDHPTYFRKERTAAAILCHSYNRNRADHEQLAELMGVDVEFLPESWYYPGAALAAIYVKR